MNSNKSIQVGDTIEKTVVAGYAEGEETHTVTYKVTGFTLVGTKQVRWAVGVAIATTDARDTMTVGTSNWIMPA